MADEAKIQVLLRIDSGKLSYQNTTTAYQADVAGQKGPSPGAITVTTDGTNVDFSQLTTPALCHIRNLDPTNYVEYGIWDTENEIFFPLGELLPGESFILRLSRNLQEEYVGTSTGTTAPTNALRFKANTASLNVLVEAFEK